MEHTPSMRTQRCTLLVLAAAMLVAVILFLRPQAASAHCDTMDGPVVSAAQAALASGNVNRMLIWVRKEDEERIRELFARILHRRAAGGKSAQEADLELFNELVRIHRAGEGADFTGLKPAGQIEPPIAALDRSLASGSPEELTTLLTGHLAERLEEGVRELVERSRFDPDDVEAGRAYIAEYVRFAHDVEGLAQMIHGAGAHAEHAAHVTEAAEEDSFAMVHGAHAQETASRVAVPHAGASSAVPAILWSVLLVSLLANVIVVVQYLG